MKDPERILSSGRSSERAMIDAAREDDPDDAAIRRARVALGLGLPVVLIPGAAEAASASATGGTAMSLKVGLLATAFVAGTGGGVYLAQVTAPPSAPPPPPAVEIARPPPSPSAALPQCAAPPRDSAAGCVDPGESGAERAAAGRAPRRVRPRRGAGADRERPASAGRRRSGGRESEPQRIPLPRTVTGPRGGSGAARARSAG